MNAWRLFRFRHADGHYKDWAVTTRTDGTVLTRWGQTSPRLSRISIRTGEHQLQLERQKQNKGYVFIGEVMIDEEGRIIGPTTSSAQTMKPAPHQKRRQHGGLLRDTLLNAHFQEPDFWF